MTANAAQAPVPADGATVARRQLRFRILRYNPQEPGSVPRMQIRLLARIAALRESSYVWDRLLDAQSPAEALEAIRSGDELMT